MCECGVIVTTLVVSHIQTLPGLMRLVEMCERCLLKPLLDHDEETGHDRSSQGGRSHEPEVVRRAEPAERSDEGSPEEDQPAILCPLCSAASPLLCHQQGVRPGSTSK